MRLSRLFWFLPLFMLHHAGAAEPPAATAKPVTLTFWNIEWFPGNRPHASNEEQARQVGLVQGETAKMDTDILGLMEVRDRKAADLAIAKMPGFKIDVCSNFPPGDSPDTQQVVIASRLPAIGAWAEQWKSGALQPPRGFSFAAYELAPGKVLLVYAVHLKSNRGDASTDIAMREESSQQLLGHMAAMAKAYGKMGTVTTIVGGDFNTSLDDSHFSQEKTLRALESKGFAWVWQGIAPENHLTLPGDGRFPPACFDHIFYSGGKLVSASVLSTPAEASDHRAITAKIIP